MLPKDELDNKIEAISRLLKLFKLERLIYVIVTLIALIVLISCAVYLLMTKKDTDVAPIVGLFGSSGAITFTLSRLLRMWNDAIKILNPITTTKNKSDKDGE